jgi:hypothetical protein
VRVVEAFPPLYAEILAAFPEAARCKPIFAWGGKIYNPHKVEVSRELVAHETVHGERQGVNPEAWWRRYIAEPQFRLMEELLAHAAEYRAHCDNPGVTRNQRRIILRHVARKLAAPLYGSLISVADAKIAIADPAKTFRTKLPGSTVEA